MRKMNGLRSGTVGAIKARLKQLPSVSSRAVFTACLAVLLAGVALNTAWSQDYPMVNPEQFAIRSDVSLAVLNLSVRDHKGHFIEGLDKKAFEVYENGVPQQIESLSHEDLPITVGLVIDSSGSMGPKRSEVVNASLRFAHCSNPEDQVFVIHFNENVSLSLPPDSPFTSSVAQLETALSGTETKGMTSLYDAVSVALDHLKKGKWDKKVLIIISDGGDNASKQNLAGIMSLVSRSNTILYTVGIFDDADVDRNPQVLTQLARVSGGKDFFPKTLAAITPIAEQIARDIRRQYTLTYVPANKNQDGTYRKIEVKARTSEGKRLDVATRAGYFAPSRLRASAEGQNNRQ
jgi:Ca-activated chloride channel homolog